MTRNTLIEAVAVGALTGLRSMAGPAALAPGRGGTLAGLTGVMALGEMIADKTSFVGNRIDPAPLAGRAVLGALAGGVVSGPRSGDRVLGAALGAAAAIVAAHLAFRARTRSTLPTAVSGAIEDAVALGLMGWIASRRR